MKTVMCFGDSITWGQNPLTRTRFPFTKRWPGILQDALGVHTHIVEEALCDRTTVWEDPFHEGRNGRAYLGVLLESHAPVDLLIIMLGTNDLQKHYNNTAATAALGCGALIEFAQRHASGPGGVPPECLLVAPPLFGKLAPLEAMAFSGMEEELKKLPTLLAEIAITCKCAFFDASAVVAASEPDGIHLSQESHQRLALALKPEVEKLIGLKASGQ